MKKNFGFTMIEILVSIAILGIVTIAGVGSVKDIRENQILKKAQSDLKLGLSEARQLALLGKKPVTTINGICETFLGNEFVVNDESYQINAKCINNSGVPFSEPTQTYNFESEILVTTSNTSVVFDMLSGKPDITEDIGYTLGIGQGSKYKVVNLGTSGRITLGQ